MHTDDLDFDLPPELVAQQPPPERGDARLLVVRAGTGEPLEIGRFDDRFLDQLRPGDLVVANDTRVINARVHVQRDTGGVGELLLLTPSPDRPTDAAGSSHWDAMARPARKYRPGMVVATVRGSAGQDDGRIRCIERTGEQTWRVELPVAAEAVPAWLELHGELPLPPYVTERGQDPGRYQTVHARTDGSVAAPTAGLHFSPELWDAVRERADVAHITLHVGAGTFLPVSEGPLAAHVMHHERYEVPPATDAAIREALAAGRRIVAIGTTSTRVLEHVYGGGQPGRPPGTPPPGVDAELELVGSTDLFIQPGRPWGCVGALLTNFHLPRSTLVALVMAFHGIDATRATYAAAVRERLRFFSFGDAMFLHGPPVDASAATRPLR